ncbi:MAG: DNA repair exonuclease [Desulfobulbaceae bacterium]|uniref:DNA repair exonuclease n=1 Tax=Candidatus Desulfobia pelagia TaxID=2841692 RepID=A0A8J6NC14_9BACT|nr:DNA repair exonuclease [Candidatus Desulfobia pelagia]
MFRFLHAADIHLDSPLSGLEAYDDAPVDEIRGASRRAFDNLIDLAIDEEVDFLLLAGDLYDGDWKDYNTGLFFVDRMARLNRADIPVFIVAGNHDAASRITHSLRLPDNVRSFSTAQSETFLLDPLGVAIHGQGYKSRALTDDIASSYPQHLPHYFNIGLLHTALTGKKGHEPYAPCSIDTLNSKGYDYWALGHIHKREEVSRNPFILFPGNIQGRHIRETGAKGATMVTVEGGEITDLNHMPLDVLRWSHCLVDISNCETGEAVYDKVRQILEKEQDLADERTLAVRLELSGATPLHSELFAHSGHWSEEFRGLATSLGDMWLEKIIFKTSRLFSLEEMAGDENPLTGLLHRVDDLDLAPDVLLDLVPEIAAFKAKLPAEILGGDDPFLDDNTATLKELRDEVKELLVNILSSQGNQT